MTTSKDVLMYIHNALNDLAKIRKEKGFFADRENPHRAIATTCESLESFFIPCLVIDNPKISRLIEEKLVFNDLLFVCKEVESKGFVGDPYTSIANVDSAAFVVSALVHAREIFKDTPKDEEFEIISLKADRDTETEEGPKKEKVSSLLDKMEEVISKGIDFLYDNWDDKTESWDKTEGFQLYFSWSVIETINEIEYYLDENDDMFRRKGSEVFEKIDKIKRELRVHIEDKFLEGMSNGEYLQKDYMNIYPQVNGIIILALLESLSVDSIAQSFLKVKETYERYHDELASSGIVYQIPNSGGTEQISDYSITPVLLRATSLLLDNYSSFVQFSEVIGRDKMRGLQDILFEELTSLEEPTFRNSSGGAYRHLWTREAFEIYYTERAIEALTVYYEFLESSEIPLHKKIRTIYDNKVIFLTMTASIIQIVFSFLTGNISLIILPIAIFILVVILWIRSTSP